MGPYAGNALQQPPLGGQFQNTQQPLVGGFQQFQQQPYPLTQPAMQPQYNAPGYNTLNQAGLNLNPGTGQYGFAGQNPLTDTGPYAPPGTLSSGHPPTMQQSGGTMGGAYGANRGGYQYQPQPGGLSGGAYTSQQYQVSPFGMPGSGMSHGIIDTLCGK